MSDESNATPEEMAAAEALRESLDAPFDTGNGGEGDDPEPSVHFTRALRAAYKSTPLDPTVNAALVKKAFAAADARRVPDLAARRQKRLALLTMGATSSVAVAAALVLFLRAPELEPRASTPFARSTEPLFTSAPDSNAAPSSTTDRSEPLALASIGSARIDRIARVRDAEYLEARFTSWGAR